MSLDGDPDWDDGLGNEYETQEQQLEKLKGPDPAKPAPKWIHTVAARDAAKRFAPQMLEQSYCGADAAPPQEGQADDSGLGGT